MQIVPTEFSDERKKFHLKMAEAYHSFLTYVYITNRADSDLQSSLAEACGKFLSCYFFLNIGKQHPQCFPERITKRYQGAMTLRYLRGDYYSEKALAHLAALHPTEGNLRFEHVLPKSAAIQRFCEDSFKSGGQEISVEGIADLLNKYWHIAVITKQEDCSIKHKSRMPDESYKTDLSRLFDRYKLLKQGSEAIVLLSTVEQGKEIRKRLQSFPG